MGFGAESAIVVQLKKTRDEEAKRLDDLLAEQRTTNDLLRQLLASGVART